MCRLREKTVTYMPRKEALEEPKSANTLISALQHCGKINSHCLSPRPWGCVLAAHPVLSHHVSEEQIWLHSFFAPPGALWCCPFLLGSGRSQSSFAWQSVWGRTDRQRTASREWAHCSVARLFGYGHPLCHLLVVSLGKLVDFFLCPFLHRRNGSKNCIFS